MTTTLTCAELEDVAVLALYGEADPEERRAWERHVASCPACRAVHEDRARVAGLGRLLGTATPPTAAMARVLAAARRRDPARRFLAMAAAAGLLMGSVLTLPPLVSTPPARPAAPEVALDLPAAPDDGEAVDRQAEGVSRRLESLRSGLEPVEEFDRRATSLAERVSRLRSEIDADEY